MFFSIISLITTIVLFRNSSGHTKFEDQKSHVPAKSELIIRLTLEEKLDKIDRHSGFILTLVI